MDRNSFIKRSLVAGGAIAVMPSTLFAFPQDKPKNIFEPEQIRDFVFAAHKDLDAVKRIYGKQPLLLNCANQAKKGDFETAMGGASHMGRRDIADFLIGKGARLDIFNYTFLGYDDFVKKLIADYPDLLNAPGPHGFTLLHHAKAGKRDKLSDWLQQKGLTQTHFKGVFG